MEKVVLWDMGTRCAMWHNWFLENYEVVCFVSDNKMVNDFKEIDIINSEELVNYKYDAIVVLTNNRNYDVFEKARLIADNPDKVFWLDDFVEKEGKNGDYEDYIRSIQISVLKEICHASDEEIHDIKWMYERVIKYGIFCFERKWYEKDASINWNYCGLQQMPEEFAEYCVYLSDLKIKTAIEIGVYRGRSSYFICAILLRNNPELKYVLVDIEDRLDHFDEFSMILPALQKKIPSSSEDYKGLEFDYVFIDADHSYDASIKDYENVGKYAKKIVAFHDIYAHEYDHENGGTVRMWKEVVEKESGNEINVFSIYPDKWMGIGCIKKRG